MNELVIPRPEPLEASPARLKDGRWGVCVTLRPGVLSEDLVGRAVKVRTRSGKKWTSVVDRVLWSGKRHWNDERVALCSTYSTKVQNRTKEPFSAKKGFHTDYHCCCGNWSGPGSACLYSFAEACDEGVAAEINWE